MQTNKLVALLKSRKFYAMIFGLLTLGVSYQFGHIPLETTEISALGILSAYILGVAVEDNGVAHVQAAQITAAAQFPTLLTPPEVTGLGGSG